MENYYTLIKELENGINDIKESGLKHIAFHKKALALCQNALNQLRIRFEQNKERNSPMLVDFFKNIKPSINSKLIYHSEMVQIYGFHKYSYNQPSEDFIKKQFKIILKFRQKYSLFIDYIESGVDIQDLTYFATSANSVLLPGDPYFESNPDFTTHYDVILSRHQAYLMVEELLHEILNKSVFNNYAKEPEISWSASKIDLAELIYALKSASCFNNGPSELLDIIKLFSMFSSIDPQEIYRSYSRIKLRTYKPAQFLRRLTTILESRIKKDYD